MFARILNTFVSRSASAALNLLIAVIISNALGPAGKGQQGLILATIAYVIVFANLMGGGAIVFLVPRFKYSLILIPAYGWTLLTALVFYILIRITHLIDVQFAAHVSILAVLNAFASVNSSILIGKERIKTSNLIAFLQPLVITLYLVIAFFVLERKDVHIYLEALYLSFATGFVISLYYLIKHGGRFTLSKPVAYLPVATKLFRYGILNQLAHVFQLLSFRMSYYWLGQVYSESEVGVYSNGVSLVEAIWLVSRSISLVQYARIANTDDRKYAQNLTVRLSKASMLLSFLFLLFLVVLPAGFFVWIFGEGFGGVGSVIRSLAPGILFFNFALIGGHYFSGTGKYHVNTLASLLGMLIAVPLFAWMIPAYGMTGAGWATSISYAFTALLVFIYFQYESRMKLKAFFPRKTDFLEFRKAVKEMMR